MARRLTLYILIGMALGIVLGFALNQHFVPANPVLGKGAPVTDPTLAAIADYLKLLPDVFLRLIKMIIAPLVFATIVTGIAGMGDSAALGRMGAKALGWFLCASLISLTLGMVLVNLFQPGAGMAMTASVPVGELATSKLTFRHFVLEIFPDSAVGAMADNSVLQILLFSVFTGIALSAIGAQGKLLVDMAEALVHLMLQITAYVMQFAPFAVFGAIASVVATKGLGILVTYAALVSEFYGGLALLWVILLSAGAVFLRGRIFLLIRYIREPVLLTFFTASSEAGLPKLFEQLDRFGVPRRVSGFILPLGYGFNLDGSMMYTSFATLFIAQAYGIHMPIGTQILMLLTLMVSSKGIASVPRASIVVIAATLTQFHLPTEGIALLLGIDTFLDMGRSATNVVGNAVATAVITRSEGMLQPPLPEDSLVAPTPFDTPEHGRKGLHVDTLQ